MPRYFKLLREGLIHKGFTYKPGLNVLSEPFNEAPMCGPGGLYFSEEKDIFQWLDWLYDDDIEWIAEVELCPDSRVVPLYRQYKADKFILGPIYSLKEFINNPANTKMAVQNCCATLCYVEDQRSDICLAAIQQDGTALQYVREQTPELCLAAVQQNGWALIYVKEQNQNPEICLAAVRQTWYALQFVKDQTAEMCLIAYAQDKAATQYFKYRTDNELNHIIY
jgi:hypothetical protein